MTSFCSPPGCGSTRTPGRSCSRRSTGGVRSCRTRHLRSEHACMRRSRRRTCGGWRSSGPRAEPQLGHPNMTPGMPGSAYHPARAAEVWAARAWNVFNEGRPFSVVYPLMVLVAAALVGLAPDGPLWLALLTATASAFVLSLFAFALRGRAFLWLAALVALPLLEPWRAPGLLAGALAGYAFFTVVVWGSAYYHLRTGAPWGNGLRFWRLVLTNSDPTSGNALEQISKLLIALSAATLTAEEATGATITRVVAALAIAAALGALASRAFAKRLPRYPERSAAPDVPGR